MLQWSHGHTMQVQARRVRPAVPPEDAPLDLDRLSMGQVLERNFGSTRTEWRRGIVMAMQRKGVPNPVVLMVTMCLT